MTLLAFANASSTSRVSVFKLRISTAKFSRDVATGVVSLIAVSAA